MFSFVSVSVSGEPGEGRGAQLKKGRGITNRRGPWKPLFLPHLPRRLWGGGREAVKNAQRDGHSPLHHFGCIQGQLSLPTSIPFPSVYPWVFPGGASGKDSTCQRRRHKRRGFDPWVGKIPWSRKWQSTPVFLPGKFHGQRNLVRYSPWGCKRTDTARHTHSVHLLQLHPNWSQFRSFPLVWWHAKFIKPVALSLTHFSFFFFFNNYGFCYFIFKSQTRQKWVLKIRSNALLLFFKING